MPLFAKTPLELELLQDNSFRAAVMEEALKRVNRTKPAIDWQTRIRTIFADYLWYSFSLPHIEFWEWVDAIRPDSVPQPFVAVWPRNRGKSTHAEMAVVDMGGRLVRSYCWYVSETQDQADKHVMTLSAMMESDTTQKYYPEIGRPTIRKTGPQAWRRNMLIADNGYVAEAIGLDKAIRGGKIGTQRPDLIVFDDIDGKHDTPEAVLKKESTITTTILPSGSHNCAVLFVQNLVHEDSIAHRLSKQPGQEKAADYLAGRIISGPYKAVDGLTYEFVKQDDDTLRWVITGGTSLWQGFDLSVCESEINREGPTAFELESQHAIDGDNVYALLSTEIINATRVSSHPDLIRAAIGVDPSGGAGACGIVGGGIARMGRVTHGYTLLDFTTPMGTSSLKWAETVLRAYHAIQADVIFVERNFGGDMAKNTIRTAVLYDNDGNVIINGSSVPIVEVQASRGKEVRAEPVATLFERGRWHHVGFFPELQKQWTRWQPGDKPSPNNLDAEVWLATGLLPSNGGAGISGQPTTQNRFAIGENEYNGSGWNKY